MNTITMLLATLCSLNTAPDEPQQCRQVQIPVYNMTIQQCTLLAGQIAVAQFMAAHPEFEFYALKSWVCQEGEPA
jgi:hypothetical protein